MHAANDPKALGIVGAVVHEAEDDGEDDTAQVTRAARDARENTVGEGMDVGDQGKIGAVTGLVEDGHDEDETEHGGLLVGVELADEDEESASAETADGDPSLLEPQILLANLVENIAHDTTHRASDEVEEAEHGSPVGSFGLAEAGEVFEVVRAENGVDSEFATEGAGIGEAVEEGLRREEDLEGLLESRLHDSLAHGSLESLGAADGNLVVEHLGALLRVATLLLIRPGLIGDATGNIDESAGDTVRLEVALDMGVAVLPRTHGSVLAEEEHANAAGKQADERHDEGDAPGLVGSVAGGHERVEDGGHDEVGDTTAGVAPTASKSVGSADHVLVEETCAPHLARNEGGTENTNKETRDVETGSILDKGSKPDGDAASQEEAGEDAAGTELVAERTSQESKEEGGRERNYVGVGHLRFVETKILLDGHSELRRRC